MFVSKKIQALVLAVCLVIMMLAGCKSQGVNTSKDEIKLNWVILGPGKQKDADVVWSEFNNKLKQKMPDTTVEFECLLPAEFVEKWKLKISSQEKMDLAWTGWLLDYVEEIRKGAYVPLDDLIDMHAPHLKTDLPEFLFEQARVNSKIYSVPNYQMVAGRRNGIRTQKKLADQYWDIAKAQEIFYRNSTMTQECYDIIGEYLAKLESNGEIRKGVSTASFAWLADKGFEPISDPYMIRMGDKNYEVVNKYETPEFKLLYTTMADWFSKNYIRKDVLSLQNTRQDEGAENGNILWVHSYMRDSAKEESAKNKYPIEVIPCGEDYYIYGGASATATAIPMVSKYPDRAMQVLGLLQTEEGEDLFNTLTYGIEGQHYNKLDGKMIEVIGYGTQASNTSPYGLWKWTIGNTFKGYQSSHLAEDYNDYVKNEVNEKAEVLTFVGFKPSLSELSSEKSQLAAVVKEFDPSLTSGALENHKAYYEQFIQKMKNAGSDKIKEALQKQMNEYIKENKVN